MNKKFSLLLLLINLSFLNIYSQNDAAYQLLDNKIGLVNTMLFNGIEYLDQEATINKKNKFFYNSQDFTKGSIVYDDNYYPDVLIKYNIKDDLILVRIPVEDKYSTFQLITSRISKFELNGNHFDNLTFQSNEKFEGFFQNLYEDSKIILFKKHRKDAIKKMERNYVYYEYETTDPNYVLKYNRNFFEANTKQDIISIFNNQKSSIRNLFREQRNLYRSQPDNFMIMLIDEISSNL